jgi:hypothetical protein
VPRSRFRQRLRRSVRLLKHDTTTQNLKPWPPREEWRLDSDHADAPCAHDVLRLLIITGNGGKMDKKAKRGT